MITEYYVLNALSGGSWLTVDEISPSSEWDDRWGAHKMLEMLENAGLVESLGCNANTNSYHISIAGEYRLSQLRERQENESKAAKEAKFNTVIGLISAVAAVVGAIFAALSFFH